jgi:hypothetical protein
MGGRMSDASQGSDRATRRRGRPRAALLLLFLAGAACATTIARSDGPLSAELRQWQSQAEELRGLAFQEPVELRPLTPEEIPGIVRAEVAATLTPEFVKAYRDAYVALGALPRDFDLLETLIALQQEQLVGLYSARERALYVLSELPPGGYSRETVVVHELVHALQHQHFPRTMGLMQGLHHNDDVVSAMSAALEGDACVTMFGADGTGGGDPDQTRDLRSAKRLSDLMLLDVDNPTGLLAHVPTLVRVSLIFPYAHGTVSAAERYEKAGNPGLDELVRDVPLASMDFVRPRVRDEVPPVDFVRLPLAELEPLLKKRGCTLAHHNVAGGVTLGVLLEEHGLDGDADAVAAGWVGDRFADVQCESGRELLWFTRWTDDASAAAFADAYREVADSVAAVAPLVSRPEPQVAGRSVLIATKGVADLVPLVLEKGEIRSYRTLSEWVADDCFTESPCPWVEESEAKR